MLRRLCILLLLPFPVISQVWAAVDFPLTTSLGAESQPKGPTPWYKKIESRWGGRIRLSGTAGDYAETTIYHTLDEDIFFDSTANIRLTNDTFFDARTYATIHYESLYMHGDTQRTQNKINFLLPKTLTDDGVIIYPSITDDRRFLSLTHSLSRNESSHWLHRLDRLALTRETSSWLMRIGRQAVTWGNGFLFNPMDLFNPFAPTQIDRDYKTGDDMVYVSCSSRHTDNLQLLYVPRRDTDNDHLEWDQSSLAGKFHFAATTTEFDVLAAMHYDDAVIGLGSRGYLGDAGWRMDVTWTFLTQKDSLENGFLSVVANLDYAWVWWKKNFYGFVEFFYNGLGEDNYSNALLADSLIGRIGRGELFTLGKTYLAASVHMEIHPLFHFFLTSINNMSDPSGLVQLYGTWDLLQNLALTCGFGIPWGGRETEFGGFTIPETDFTSRPPVNGFLWLTFYF
jgi:hypothetical protein